MVEPYPSEKYEFVSWDDDIPNMMEKTIHVPNHQPDNFLAVQSQNFPLESTCVQAKNPQMSNFPCRFCAKFEIQLSHLIILVDRLPYSGLS